MARIAEILDLEQKLRTAIADKAKVEEEKELYRLFIIETGRSRAFLLWRARRLNVDPELIEMLETPDATSYQTVPREPTEAMLKAGCLALEAADSKEPLLAAQISGKSHDIARTKMRLRYKAMLAADLGDEQKEPCKMCGGSKYILDSELDTMVPCPECV